MVRGPGHEGGVEHGGARALELPRLGVHAVREGDMGLARCQCRAQRYLVRGVGVGVNEAYGHGLDAELLHLVERGGDRILRQWHEHGAIRFEPLGNFEAQLLRHQGGQLRRHVEAVEVAAVLAPNGEGIAESLCGDERHAGELALDDGVGRHGRAVHQVGDLVPAQADGRERRVHAGHGLARHAAHLGRAVEITLRVDGHHVGEGAADIDADLPGFGHGVMCSPVAKAGTAATNGVSSSDRIRAAKRAAASLRAATTSVSSCRRRPTATPTRPML